MSAPFPSPPAGPAPCFWRGAGEGAAGGIGTSFVVAAGRPRRSRYRLGVGRPTAQTRCVTAGWFCASRGARRGSVRKHRRTGGARPHENWDEVQADLVEQPSIQELLRNVCAAVHHDILCSGGLSCPLWGCLNPSVTKMYEVPSFLTIVSAGRSVTTKQGAWKVGSSPTHRRRDRPSVVSGPTRRSRGIRPRHADLRSRRTGPTRRRRAAISVLLWNWDDCAERSPRSRSGSR